MRHGAIVAAFKSLQGGKGRIYWVRPPFTLIPPLWLYFRDVKASIYAVLQYAGTKMVNEGRTGGPWKDRTGNARGGIFYAIDGLGFSEKGKVSIGDATLWHQNLREDFEIEGDADKIYLGFSHSMWYGSLLEFSYGGQYAILLSTFERNLPQLEANIKRTFSL